jgi:uncharacterized protein YaiE (UPF0345 family)
MRPYLKSKVKAKGLGGMAQEVKHSSLGVAVITSYNNSTPEAEMRIVASCQLGKKFSRAHLNQ